jgi:hypothetical protein
MNGVQSTAHQTIHFRLYSALISRALALISNCKCVAWRAVDRTLENVCMVYSRRNNVACVMSVLVVQAAQWKVRIYYVTHVPWRNFHAICASPWISCFQLGVKYFVASRCFSYIKKFKMLLNCLISYVSKKPFVILEKCCILHYVVVVVVRCSMAQWPVRWRVIAEAK